MTFYGYTPYEHQWAVHKAMAGYYKSGRMFVVKSKRQVGKTTMAENILLECAIKHPSTLSVLVEPTLDQCRRVYKEMVRAIEDTPILRRKNDSLLEIELDTGSQILFKSAEQRDNLRGFTITGILVVDECAFIQDEIFDILMPTTDVHGAPILLISTPKLKQGAFYRYYMAGLDKNNKGIVSIDFNDYDTSFLLPPHRLEQYRTMMPKAQFTTEYLGEFLDSDSILFTNLSECIAPPPERFERAYVGIDWGSGAGGDYTSVAIFSEGGKMLQIDYFNDKPTFEQVKYICKVLQPYGTKINSIQAESNSIGTPMIALLRDELRHTAGLSGLVGRVLPFVTTAAEKVRLVNQLQVGLEQKAITLLGDRGLISQLSAYEATYNPKTNNVSYNAPAGMHDDNCISTMLAYDAFLQAGRRGSYTLGFVTAR